VAPCLFLPTSGDNNCHSTYRFGTVIIAYRWHPLHGKRLPVVRRRGRRGTEVIDVLIRQGVSRELPAWMTDEAACRVMSQGPPQISVGALMELRAVLSLGSPTASPAESSDGNKKKPSTETILKARKRTVHSGPPFAAKPAPRDKKQKRTADVTLGSPTRGRGDGVSKEPSGKGGRR